VGNLTALTRADKVKAVFAWLAGAQADFDALKRAMTAAPVLAHFMPARQTILETDASNYALGAVISQFDKEGILYPCGFALRKMQPAELNYPIHDKELLGLVWALSKYRGMLLSCHNKFKVVANHDALKYFMDLKLLTWRQARWNKFMSDFGFKTFYRPGRLGTKPDKLSRKPDV
jgi:hypothetical protein